MYRYIGFPGGSDGKESACNSGDPDSIPRSGRSPDKGMATPCLAWEIPRTEEPGGLQSVGVRESDMTEQLTPSLSYIYIYTCICLCVCCHVQFYGPVDCVCVYHKLPILPSPVFIFNIGE